MFALAYKSDYDDAAYDGVVVSGSGSGGCGGGGDGDGGGGGGGDDDGDGDGGQRPSVSIWNAVPIWFLQ